jgi:cellulose synthase/poly-beta-1,6-N-acetylglucosamine synthase-like glycosyltransferase
MTPTRLEAIIAIHLESDVDQLEASLAHWTDHLQTHDWLSVHFVGNGGFFPETKVGVPDRARFSVVESSRSKASNLNFAGATASAQLLAVFDIDSRVNSKCLELAVEALELGSNALIQGPKLIDLSRCSHWYQYLLALEQLISAYSGYRRRYRSFSATSHLGAGCYLGSILMNQIQFNDNVLAEDVEFSIRAQAAPGVMTVWDDAIWSSEAPPATSIAAVLQRHRWMCGWREVLVGWLTGSIEQPTKATRLYWADILATALLLNLTPIVAAIALGNGSALRSAAIFSACCYAAGLGGLGGLGLERLRQERRLIFHGFPGLPILFLVNAAAAVVAILAPRKTFNVTSKVRG